MKRNTALVMVVLFLNTLGCATQRTAESMKIVEADEDAVKKCRMVGETVGSSMYGGLFMQEAGKNSAKNEAINSAANMQATHLVWRTAEGGFWGGKAVAAVYDCRLKK